MGETGGTESELEGSDRDAVRDVVSVRDTQQRAYRHAVSREIKSSQGSS